MSEYAWMRAMVGIATHNPEQMLTLAQEIKVLVPPDSTDREMQWRVGFLHQLAKVACGAEGMCFGPYVQLFPLTEGPTEAVFPSDPDASSMQRKVSPPLHG